MENDPFVIGGFGVSCKILDCFRGDVGIEGELDISESGVECSGSGEGKRLGDGIGDGSGSGFFSSRLLVEHISVAFGVAVDAYRCIRRSIMSRREE